METKKFNAEDFFGFLFRLRDVAHLSHLRTVSYETHVALQEFYEGILPKIDAIVESWQGYNEKLATITIPAASPIEDMIPVLRDSHDYIQKSKINFSGDVQNLLDECSSLCNRTIYKLRFLK